MKPSFWTIALAGIALAALYAGAFAQSGSVLSANLYGNEVAGGEGAEEGASGDFNGYAEAGLQSLCYYLEAQGIDTVTAAHIHQGRRGRDGPEVLELQMAADDELCVTVAGDLASRMVGKPGDYYVDLHTARFPDGALRGQLHG